jgi:molybdopterin molybdotransferase
MARAAGAHVRVSPFARDDQSSIVALLADALCGTDLLITIGGVSVGDHDLVRPALQSLGVSVDFWKVKIKPGKPIAVGRRGETRVIGLPGNPASAQVTFGLFGMPLLRAMQSDLHPTPSRLRAHLVKSIERAPGRTEFLRSVMEHQGTQLVVHALGNQASGASTSMAMADSLIVVPSDVERLEAGTEVDVIRLSDL